MKNRYYICEYCQIEYLPKRRNHQRFCSNSCRSKAHHIKQRDKIKAATTNEVKKPSNDMANSQDEDKKSELQDSVTDEKTITDGKRHKNKIDAISPAGVANATLGSLTAEMLQSLLTKNDNKPATKKDLKMLVQRMARYYRVNNLPKRIDQTIPVFDTYTGSIIYVNTTKAIQLLNPSTNF